jgi:hypothetical protein
MASNKDLITAILAISATAVTKDLTNAQLAEVLKELKAPAEAEAKALADAAEAEAKALADAAADADGDKPFVVAPGKAITSKRGILAEGVTVSPSDFAGGEVAFADLCKKGHIVK